MQDSDYYQEYSYRISSKTDINTYKTTLTDVAHLAGTKMFGEFVLKDEMLQLQSQLTTLKSQLRQEQFDQRKIIYQTNLRIDSLLNILQSKRPKSPSIKNGE